jgi:hypothetical protein
LHLYKDYYIIESSVGEVPTSNPEQIMHVVTLTAPHTTAAHAARIDLLVRAEFFARWSCGVKVEVKQGPTVKAEYLGALNFKGDGYCPNRTAPEKKAATMMRACVKAVAAEFAA